jgi:thiamine thiazole synthase
MSPAQTLDTPLTTYPSSQKYDVAENYEGQYRFAPIEEAEVSRAMIKRYV